MMMDVLEALRVRFAALPGVASARIGLEPNISPADYPLVRIVPDRITPAAYGKREAECSIFFGVPIATSEGLDAVYTALFALESAIIAAVRAHGGRYLETITDSDRLDTYKMMAVRCRVEG